MQLLGTWSVQSLPVSHLFLLSFTALLASHASATIGLYILIGYLLGFYYLLLEALNGFFFQALHAFSFRKLLLVFTSPVPLIRVLCAVYLNIFSPQLVTSAQLTDGIISVMGTLTVCLLHSVV